MLLCRMKNFKLSSKHFTTLPQDENVELVRVAGRNRADEEIFAEKDRLLPITAQNVSHTVDLARYCFEQFAPKHLGKKVQPHFVCYGNNAASLGQAANILAEQGNAAHVTVIPSAGFSKRLYGGHEPTQSTLSKSDSVEAYRQLFRDAKISPDDVVKADPKHPIVFIRPLAVTAISYSALQEFMENWLDDIVKERFPRNPLKQIGYKTKFYANSYIVGIKSQTMHGGKTEPFKPTKWNAAGHQLHIIPPEEVSESVWKMRNLSWIGIFRSEVALDAPHKATKFDEQTHGRIIEAMRECAGKDTSKADESPTLHASNATEEGTLKSTYIEGLTGGNKAYAKRLEEMGYPAQHGDRSL